MSEGGDEALHTDPPGGSLVPPHKILKVVNRKDLQKRDYIANPSSEEGV